VGAVRVSASDRNLGGWHDCALAHIRSAFHACLSAGISSTLLPGLEHPRIHRRHPAVAANRFGKPKLLPPRWPSIPSRPDRTTTVPETAGCVIAQPRAALRWLIAASALPRSARGRQSYSLPSATRATASLRLPFRIDPPSEARVRPDRNSASRMACAAWRGSGACTRVWCMYSVMVGRARTMP
jgi:hypothetical protein